MPGGIRRKEKLCGGILVALFALPNLKVTVPARAQVSHTPTRDSVWKTHAAANAMTARRWLAH
eukprot:2750849-Pyramimonas_sp.AAC.1